MPGYAPHLPDLPQISPYLPISRFGMLYQTAAVAGAASLDATPRLKERLAPPLRGHLWRWRISWAITAAP